MLRATGCQGGRTGSPPDSELVLNAVKEGGRRVRAGGGRGTPIPNPQSPNPSKTPIPNPQSLNPSRTLIPNPKSPVEGGGSCEIGKSEMWCLPGFLGFPGFPWCRGHAWPEQCLRPLWDAVLRVRGLTQEAAHRPSGCP
jgi:hypothetical protein